MSIRKRIAVVAIAVLVAAGIATTAEPRAVRIQAPVQAPHSIYVDVPPPGMLPEYLCAFPIKSSACAEDTTGWVGSSEDDRVKA